MKRKVIVNLSTKDLKEPWRNRVRTDLEVTGAIELAYARGYQAGWEDSKKKRRPKYYVGETT